MNLALQITILPAGGKHRYDASPRIPKLDR
jgi:hypothetical protein